MDEELKAKIIESIGKQLPKVAKERIETNLDLVLLEIDSFNSCKKKIEFDKLQGVIIEVLYQVLKNESEQTVSSVRRGDTTVSYSSGQHETIKYLIDGYKDLIKQVIGCGEVRFFC